MADENRFRSTRLGSAYPRAAEPSRSDEYASGNDPLAELARLIGKNDPYAHFGLSDQAPQETDKGYLPAPPGRDEVGRAQERYEEPYSQSQPHEEPYAGSYGGREGDHAAYQPSTQAQYPSPQNWRAEHDPRAFDPPFGDPPQSAYADDRSNPGEEAYTDEAYYDDDQLEPQAEPAYEQEYDDPPRAGRRGGLATALALIGCAMLGTAGAYGYRSYYGPTAVVQPPPVITADNSTPTKIVPPPAGDSQAGKVIQDRLANAGKEQIVSKQEEPVALKDLGTQALPRVVLPAPVAPAATPSPQMPAGPGNATGSNEPKKVRTVTIRPDGAEAGARSGGAPSSAGAGGAQPGAAPPARGAPPAKGSSNPLSLDPQGTEPGAAPARIRTATVPLAPRGGSESGGTSPGGFLVQLSSQKTEAEASSSFRSLQAKFPNELGGKTPIIRRADLGAKGIFYRTMVGPFGSSQEAAEFCASFKTAGGHCVVPNN